MSRRPAVARMVWAYLRHTNRGFWRTPIAAFFTLVFPLMFLLLIAALTGNRTLPGTDVRVAQFLTPAIAVFAATIASFTSLAVGLVEDRELGVLKRVRGTPLPPSAFLAARVGSAVWIALVAVAVMLAVGVAFLDVQLIPRTAPAALLTLVVGIGSFAVLGLAVVGLSPSEGVVNAVTNGIVIPLAFISDIFAVGAELPTWLERIGWFFPLKHFVAALADTFDPFAEGAQFGWDHLAVMLAWGAAGVVVALRTFSWEPPTARTSRRKRARSAGTTADPVPAAADPAPAAVAPAPAARPGTRSGVLTPGRPGTVALIAAQTRAALRAFSRDTASAFFTVGFPVILLLLLPVVFGREGQLASRGGIPVTQFLAPVLAVYGAATTAYADFSQRVALARDHGTLKRIHGTPLPVWAFVAGRTLMAVIVAFASLVVTMAVGIAVYGVELVPRALPGLLAATVVGVACFAALGLAIAAIVPDADTVPTLANATLLPLAFFSDIFLIGDLPTWMDRLGSLFPLKHFANAVADAVNPTIPGAGFSWDHLAVMSLWLVVGVVIALRFWRWEPHRR